jgi:3-deoxy-manno-octulosonate cytidylyltransferase (CMP-KDO synthetase)
LASQRLPGKLLLDKTGRTVLEHTLERALEARRGHPRLFRTILVACDDERLAQAARRAGVAAVLTRTDHASGTDRIVEAVRKTRLSEQIIVNLQADEPEIDPENLVRVAKLLARAPKEVPMATLAAPIRDPETWQRPNVVKVVADARGRALYFSRAPIPFIREPQAVPLDRQRAAPAAFPAAPNTLGASAGAVRQSSMVNCQSSIAAAPRLYGLHHLGLYAYRRDFLLRFPKLPRSPLEETEKLEQLRVLEAGYDILVGPAVSNPPGIDTPEEYEAFVQRQGRTARDEG